MVMHGIIENPILAGCDKKPQILLALSDEDPGLRIESFAIIKIRGVSTKIYIIFFSPCRHYKELKNNPI